MTYALVLVADGTVVADIPRLPWRVDIPGVLRCDVDRSGATVTDRNGAPAYVVVPVVPVSAPSRFHTPGTVTLTFDGECVHKNPGWTADASIIAARILNDVKARTMSQILALCPEWKQRNLTAQAAVLVKKGVQNWTADDQAAWDAGEAIWSQIAALRAASDILEASVLACGDDIDALIAWDMEHAQ